MRGTRPSAQHDQRGRSLGTCAGGCGQQVWVGQASRVELTAPYVGRVRHEGCPIWLFHATTRDCLSAIMLEGLVPSDEPVHLADDVRLAHASCQLGVREVDDADVVVLRVDVRGLRLSPGFDGPGTYAHPGVIAASRLGLAP